MCGRIEAELADCSSECFLLSKSVRDPRMRSSQSEYCKFEVPTCSLLSEPRRRAKPYFHTYDIAHSFTLQLALLCQSLQSASRLMSLTASQRLLHLASQATRRSLQPAVGSVLSSTRSNHWQNPIHDPEQKVVAETVCGRHLVVHLIEAHLLSASPLCISRTVGR